MDGSGGDHRPRYSRRSSGKIASDDFYKGKNIRIIVGFAAGGGFDSYSRVIGRHMGKFIPGNPSIVVDNMTGAGSLIAAGIHDTQIFTRPYVFPPGTPKERVQVLRKAFIETFKDKGFLAEAESSKLDVDPVAARAGRKNYCRPF